MSELVYFDTTSSDTLGIIFLGGTIGTPVAKTLKVEIPYSDGNLDLTDYYGVVRYNNRTISLDFIVDPSKDRETVIKDVMKLNGQRVKLIVPNTPNEYYMGRISVSDSVVTNNKKLQLKIICDAEPYRYTDVSITKTFTAAGTIVCESSQQIVSPTITNDAAATFVLGTVTKTYSAGTRVVNEFKFMEGNNTITVTPSGASVTVTITYRKGRI